MREGEKKEREIREEKKDLDVLVERGEGRGAKKGRGRSERT